MSRQMIGKIADEKLTKAENIWTATHAKKSKTKTNEKILFPPSSDYTHEQ